VLTEQSSTWPKKVALWLTNCAPFNSFIIYIKIHPATQIRYKKFLVQVAKYWAADKMEAIEAEPDRLNVTRTINSNSM
jgi:hypothetical protein